MAELEKSIFTGSSKLDKTAAALEASTKRKFKGAVASRPTASVLAPAPVSLTRLRVSTRTVALFTRQLSVMLLSGVPLVRALSQLTLQTEHPAFGHLVESCLKEIESGRSITRTFSKYPRVFSPLYISMAKVGEVNGTFPESLSSIADFLEKDELMVKKAKAALTYPCIVLGVAIVICWAMFNFLLPHFTTMFEEMHMELPMLTRVLIVMVHVTQSPLTILFVAAATAGLVQIYNRMSATEEGRYYLDNIKLGVPVLAGTVRKIAVARMARSLSTLLGTGIPVATALKLSGDSCGNEVVRRSLYESVENVENGKPLSYSFDPERSQFDPIVYYMVAIGEETGRLDTLMNKLASYYEQEVNYVLDSIGAILEPVFTAAIGLFVGVICLGIFLPLYGLISNLGNT